MSYRLSKDTTACYFSFEEMRKAYGDKPIKKKPNNAKKLEEVQNKFKSYHKCRACGKFMDWIGGNLMSCTNPQCRGIKVEREDNEGNKIVEYITSYDILNDHFAEVAENIFT